MQLGDLARIVGGGDPCVARAREHGFDEPRVGVDIVDDEDARATHVERTIHGLRALPFLELFFSLEVRSAAPRVGCMDVAASHAHLSRHYDAVHSRRDSRRFICNTLLDFLHPLQARNFGPCAHAYPCCCSPLPRPRRRRRPSPSLRRRTLRRLSSAPSSTTPIEGSRRSRTPRSPRG